MESGRWGLYASSIDLAELVRDTVAAYQAPARERDLRLEQHVDGEVAIAADAERLQRVLRNLLDNALRHTPPGGTIAVEASRTGGQASVSIRDIGPGVAAQYLERIFESFYLAEPSRRRDQSASP